MRSRLRRWLVLAALLLVVAVSVGGGTTYVALSITTKPQFCNTCHIMEPYYESWKTSSHKDVQCVDCHYEPGLLETVEGKFKALSQLAKYVTGTQGTKPWAEVSDYSCLRSGCHSTRLLEGEIQYGRIRFDHRHHLIGDRRGKTLRCTSCHSQIVQGDHINVTPTTCILCHFKPSAEGQPKHSCDTCHGPPPEEIRIGEFTFRHSDYLERGVECASCHGDVTRGTGDVPRERCGTCHNRQEHLERYDDVEFVHRHHVTEHSVDCLECHTAIEHGLPARTDHFQGDCKSCHLDTHGSSVDLYRGAGGQGVPERPSAMFLARVTCNGCHRPPFPGAPAAQGGATYAADPLACIDCHGPGYEGMAEAWQGEFRRGMKSLQANLERLSKAIGEEREEADPAEAKRRYADAARNLGVVLLDRSEGAHNPLYARDLLRKADEDLRAGFQALDPDDVPKPVAIGPKVAAKEGCTILCHSAIEEKPIDGAFGLPFPHATHLLKGKLDCSSCHAGKPHGAVTITKESCVSCHHGKEEATACGSCHAGIRDLRAAVPEGSEGVVMGDLDCLGCHETLREGHSLAAVQRSCDACHSDEGPAFASKNWDRWLEPAETALGALEARLGEAPAELAAEARRRIEALRAAGIWHNVDAVKAEAEALLARIAPPK